MNVAVGAPQPHRMITEPLTWQEIWELFPDQFLVLLDVQPVSPGAWEFHTARVIGAGDTLAQACEQASLWRISFTETTVFSTRRAAGGALDATAGARDASSLGQPLH